MDPDQDRYSVGPGLGPNCLQRLSAKDASRQRGSTVCMLGIYLSTADIF